MDIIKSFYRKKEEPFSKSAFQNPSVDYAPIYGWVWNDKLEQNEIIAQLDEMQRLGIQAIYVIPEPKHFRPQTLPTDLEPEYLSDEYMKIYRFMSDEAVKRGMVMWLYDEGGWPSGGACGKVLAENPSLVKRGLECKTTEYKKGMVYCKPEDILAAFINKTQQIATGYVFAEDAEIDEYFSQKYYWDYFGAADFPDILLAESTKKFIECTHDVYKPYLCELFGDKITAVFTDEGRGPGPYPFREEMVNAFEEKYGYSILPYLPLLLNKVTANKQEEQVFIDYYELCSEWYCKNYLLQERQWCNENGMCFTGHIDKDDDILGAYNGGYHYATLRAVRCLDIPGIDVIWRQIWHESHEMSAQYDFFPRLASSAAEQNGAGRSMTESFGVYGTGLTYDEIRYVIGAQAIRGVNIFNLLTISYGRHDHYMAGELPSFTEAFFPDLKVINEYLSRLSYLSSIGEMKNTVALYMPAQEMHIPYSREKIARSFKKCGDELEGCGIPFDIIDDDFFRCVDMSALENGRLALALAEYTEVVLPDCQLLSQDVVNVLETFITRGGKVYVVSEFLQEKICGARLIETCKDVFAFDRCVQTDEGILCQKRICANGTLLLFYNRTKDEKFVRLCNKQEAENAYFINVTMGKLYKAPESIVVYSGETVGILLTDDVIEVEDMLSFSEADILNDFTFRKTKSFSFSASNFIEQEVQEEARKIVLTDWQELNGKDFSGCGVYETQFEYTGKDGLLLDCGDVRYSCEVFVNGSSVGVKVMPPYIFEIAPSILQAKNMLTIRVTNTAANAYTYTDTFKDMEKLKLSPYFETCIKLGRDSLSGGLLGPVTLYKKDSK